MKHSKATLPQTTETRKRRFLVALRAAGTTMEAWAAGAGVTQGYVSNVLAGRRENPDLTRKIEAFTKKHLWQVKHVA